MGKTREEKKAIVAELKARLKEEKNFYIVNVAGLKATEDNLFRKKLYEKGLRLKVVKNTLLKKALEQAAEEAANGVDYSAIYEVLRGSSAVIFVKDALSEPAKVIKAFREELGRDAPQLKAAYIEESVYIGDEQLEALTKIKSKQELIAELIVLLRSPIYQVLQTLQSAPTTLMQLLKSLEERT